MKFATLSALSLVALNTISATPTPRANCGKGRTAASATVWLTAPGVNPELKVFGSGDDAHDALRLSFHDAIGYSPKMIKEQKKFGGGGADGSLIKFATTELPYPANEGLEEIVGDEKVYADRWNVSYGDIIQFAGAVSVRNCAGGPRISFMAGRPEATGAAPEGLVPEAFDSVTTMLSRVADAGLTPEELVDLLASHSIGVQDHVDRSIPDTPFDTTPTVFDTNFYLETLLRGTVWPGKGHNNGEVASALKSTFRLESDYALSRDKRTSCHWQSFVNNQSRMADRFAAAMAKMALIGQNPAKLVDCSEVIPVSTLRAPSNAKMPVGKNLFDLQMTCPANLFSNLSNLPGLLGKLLTAVDRDSRD
ncbi:putative versatile peroxidase [Mycena crocata]|nr:putative versatile peroxidase [Mycena crocata]